MVIFSTADASDAIVYRVALWSCTFTLAISVGAGVLLPFSILSNEVLVFYPNNFYMKWLNGSLIHGKISRTALKADFVLILREFPFHRAANCKQTGKHAYHKGITVWKWMM